MSAWNEPIYPWNVQFDLHSYLLTEMPVMMTIMMTMLFSSAPSFFLSTFCALLLFTWQAFCWSNLDWFGKLIRYTPPHLSNQAPSSPCHCLSAHERWESKRDVESCWYLHCTPRLPHTSTCELKSSNLPPHQRMLKEKLIKLFFLALESGHFCRKCPFSSAKKWHFGCQNKKNGHHFLILNGYTLTLPGCYMIVWLYDDIHFIPLLSILFSQLQF